MNVIQRSVALAAGLALLCGSAVPFVLAAPTPLFAMPAERLTIHITATGGTVWGRVAVRYNGVQRICASASCSLAVPHGATIRVSQTPTNASTWPFQQWTFQPMKAGMRSWSAKGTSTSVKMKTSYAVTAVYVVTSGGGWGQ